MLRRKSKAYYLIQDYVNDQGVGLVVFYFTQDITKLKMIIKRVTTKDFLTGSSI